MGACPVHHLLEGPDEAPAIVFVNSLGATLAMWDPQAEALRERFRVLRYDARGHGGSPVPPGPYSIADLGGDLVALLDRLGIERASICGVSLGGATAIWAAANAPERVDRLGVCFSSAHFNAREAYMQRAALVRVEGAGTVADAVVHRWFTPALFERDPATTERMREMIAATPAEGYASCAEAVATLDLRGDLARISAPTLVLAGAEDPACPPELVKETAAGIPGARFVEVERAAHLGNYEQPQRVTELIVEHLSAPPGAEAKEEE